MRIVIKLFGELKMHAPGDQSQFALTVPRGTTLGDIHERLAIPEHGHVCLINGRRAHGDFRFEEGDTLVMFPPLAGG
ncbi:MAG: MoaD/ThiS family protein [Desulfobacteraceae bacterium]|jgi:molybdopterin converting factor small subunit